MTTVAASSPSLRRVTGPARPGQPPWPLYGVAATRQIEQQAQAALPPHTLMRRAGLAVARLALAIAPHARRIWLLAGPGNNGGDALEAALHLHGAGKAVQVSLLGDPQRLPDDARTALARATQAGVTIAPAWDEADATGADLVIDGLLGIGSRRAPAGVLAEAIRTLHATAHAHRPVLAIDLPTGLDADTGALPDDGAGPCVRATHTISLLTLKPGLFTAQGRDHAGEVWLDDLGVTPDLPPQAELSVGGPAPGPRRHAQHKGSFGDVLVLGGAPGMAGAGVLCARAALAAGAGRVHLGLLDPDAPGLDLAMPELMLRPRSAWDAMDWGSLTLACGCGGGEAVRTWLPRALAEAAQLVLDADALNALAADPALMRQLQARSARGAPTILTPHPLEAARLLGCRTQDVQGDRLAAAGELAARSGATVVLKGSGTVVATPGRCPAINASGNAALATAGTGDVLCGWLAGLWARGNDAHATALAAVAAHGHAADTWRARHPDAPLSASLLVDRLRRRDGA